MNDIALFDLVARLQLCYAIGGEAPASTHFEYPEMHFLESCLFLINRGSQLNLPLIYLSLILARRNTDNLLKTPAEMALIRKAGIVADLSERISFHQKGFRFFDPDVEQKFMRWQTDFLSKNP